jgi:hypothetical protein
VCFYKVNILIYEGADAKRRGLAAFRKRRELFDRCTPEQIKQYLEAPKEFCAHCG